KKFSLFRKNSLKHYNRLLALLFKHLTKQTSTTWNSLLRVSFSMFSFAKCNNYRKRKKIISVNLIHPKQTSFKKRVLSSRLKQIRLSILISPDIGNIQIGINSEKQGIDMIKFEVEKFLFFLELSSMGKIYNIKYKKTEKIIGKCIHNQHDDIWNVAPKKK
ncbi:hypothetical protein RFI_35622, partial [Reticulomyxa filosa]